MIWNDLPLGMIRLDELLNILRALALTDCDLRTLEIVATSTGLDKHLQSDPALIQLPQPQPGEVKR